MSRIRPAVLIVVLLMVNSAFAETSRIRGVSSGGLLSILMGKTGKDGEAEAKDPVDRSSSKVQAVASFFPPTDLVNYGEEGRLFNQFEPVKFAWHTIPVASLPRDRQIKIL